MNKKNEWNTWHIHQQSLLNIGTLQRFYSQITNSSFANKTWNEHSCCFKSWRIKELVQIIMWGTKIVNTRLTWGYLKKEHFHAFIFDMFQLPDLNNCLWFIQKEVLVPPCLILNLTNNNCQNDGGLCLLCKNTFIIWLHIRLANCFNEIFEL